MSGAARERVVNTLASLSDELGPKLARVIVQEELEFEHLQSLSNDDLKEVCPLLTVV